MRNQLVCDIGGTNSRFAVASIGDNGVVALSRVRRFTNSDYPFASHMLEAYIESDYQIRTDGVSVAIAGRAEQDRGLMVNAPRGSTGEFWTEIGAGMFSKYFPGASIRFINDLEAAMRALIARHHVGILESRCVIAVDSVWQGNIALMMPGTGLGAAFCVWDSERGYGAISRSEGAHAAWAVRTKRDWDLLQFVQSRDRCREVCAEKVLSGAGILRCYDFFCTQSRIEPGNQSAVDVIRIGMEEISEGQPGPAAQTASFIADQIAAEAAAMGVRFVATGGVFLSGNIICELVPLLTTDRFVSELSVKAAPCGLARHIPIYLILDENLPMHGAAYASMNTL